MRRANACVLAAAALLALDACDRAPDRSPPAIRLGEHECDWCRMLISDERFAAALVFEQDGRVVKLAFDDINCVYSYLSDNMGTPAHTVYTHDFETRAWLNARDAIFVHSDKLETPMAAQLAALSSRAAAERVAQRFPGAYLTIEDVARRFTRVTGAATKPGDAAP